MIVRSAKGDAKRLSRSDVIVEPTSHLVCCPKCSGVLVEGGDIRLEDLLWCVHCGWRPGAKLKLFEPV